MYCWFDVIFANSLDVGFNSRVVFLFVGGSGPRRLSAWHSDRTPVFDRRTFLVPRSTLDLQLTGDHLCGWRISNRSLCSPGRAIGLLCVWEMVCVCPTCDSLNEMALGHHTEHGGSSWPYLGRVVRSRAWVKVHGQRKKNSHKGNILATHERYEARPLKAKSFNKYVRRRNTQMEMQAAALCAALWWVTLSMHRATY